MWTQFTEGGENCKKNDQKWAFFSFPELSFTTPLGTPYLKISSQMDKNCRV